MPKKHKQIYHKPNNPTYVHPSLGNGSQGSISSNGQAKPPVTLSVNEKLSNLRLAQASPASAERKRELAALSNQRSLPPSLGQGILGLPAGAAPAPRNNAARSRIRLRTPGPAPPPSWSSRPVTTQYHAAPRSARVLVKKAGPERKRPEELARFLNMTGDNPVPSGSLLHMALKSAAENWLDIIEDCADSLDLIPAHLRATLLSYLTKFGPDEGVDMIGVLALFPNRSEVSSLDLSGLAGWSLSLKELRKWLKKTDEESKIHRSEQDGPRVSDSWDQELGLDEEIDRFQDFTLPPTLDIKIQHLTRLSLAYPPPSISWTDLLSLSKNLHTITHLSLAHWPLPTRTPNLSTTTYISRTGVTAPAGATNLYTTLDRDYEESALVLKQLAENTYCLRWLDLQGCSDWIEALTWHSSTTTSPTTEEVPTQRNETSEWASAKAPQGPSWNGAWRHITYLNLSQSEKTRAPRNPHLLKNPTFRQKLAAKYFRLSPSQLQIFDDLRQWLLQQQKQPGEKEMQKDHCVGCHGFGEGTECRVGCEKCEGYGDEAVRRYSWWLEREEEARCVARRINGIRARGANARCLVDHGWCQRQSYPVSVFTRQ